MQLYDDGETTDSAEQQLGFFRAFLIDRKGDPELIEALDLALDCIEKSKERPADAKWIHSSGEDGPEWECSNCVTAGSDLYRFCPHCGAKMTAEN